MYSVCVYIYIYIYRYIQCVVRAMPPLCLNCESEKRHWKPRGTRSHERHREAVGGHGAPEATRGHGRPQEATRSHGRPRAAPHRPPKNIIPTKMGRPGSPERSVKKKTGDGGPRGATGGNGAAGKKPGHTNRPLQYPRGPLQAAPVWGIYNYIYIYIYTHIYTRYLLQKV